MRIFISGGCKNGKSTQAQRWAKKMAEESACVNAPLYYVATMLPGDEEDFARIRRHRKERDGWGFETIEQPRHIDRIFEKTDPDGVYLLDSLTALLANEMFQSEEPDADSGLFLGAPEKVLGELTTFAETARDWVIVSDYIYGGGYAYDELTLAYMRGLALLDRHMAALADVCAEAVCGTAHILKGAEKRSAGVPEKPGRQRADKKQERTPIANKR